MVWILKVGVLIYQIYTPLGVCIYLIYTSIGVRIYQIYTSLGVLIYQIYTCRYYAKDFDWAHKVVTMRQIEPLSKFEKWWISKPMAIEG